MVATKKLCISCRGNSFVPYYLGNKIFFPKNFITQFTEICCLIIVNGNKNHPIVPQQVRGQPQARIHHVQPVCVVAAHRFRVALGGLPGYFHVPPHRVGKIIFIYKVIARIVWRVYVNHFHFAEIGFLQQLQHFQIVALDIEVLSRIKIHAL